MNFKSILFLCTLVAAICFSCNKSSQFGGDLLGNEAIETIFTDTVAVQMKMVRNDSINTSDPNSIAAYLLCGAINDPVLGTSSATIYTGLQLSAFNVDFKDVTLDSAVLYLGIDPFGVYGDTNQVMQIEVTELAEHPLSNKSYFSNSSLSVKQGPDAIIGTGSYLPRPNQGQPIIDTAGVARDSAFGSYFRIPLTNEFGNRVLELDTNVLRNDTLFWAKIPGLRIRSTTPGAILGLNLNDRTFSRITLYYKKDTSNTQRVFNLQFIGENKFVQFERQPSDFITDRIDNIITDDFLAIQGMGGNKIEVEIPYADTVNKKDWLINTAELVLYVANVPNDNLSKFTPARQLSATVKRDTVFAFLDDITYSFNVSNNTFSFFGGNPVEVVENGSLVTRYKMSIPSHLQDIILGKSSKKFFINTFPTVTSAQRSVLYSPGTISPYRARLNIRYTKI
jgi:hypothetical protein